MYLFLRLVNAELAKYEKYQRFVQCTMLCQEEFERMVIDEMFNMFKNCIVRLHFKKKKNSIENKLLFHSVVLVIRINYFMKYFTCDDK